MKISIHAEGTAELRAVLSGAPASAHRNVVKAVEFTARGIRDAAREFASGIGHAPHYPRSITYDVESRITAAGHGAGVRAEIGPDKDRTQGALGNILEYGTVNNAPYAHLGPALDRWGSDLDNGLGKAAADALEGR